MTNEPYDYDPHDTEIKALYGQPSGNAGELPSKAAGAKLVEIGSMAMDGDIARARESWRNIFVDHRGEFCFTIPTDGHYRLAITDALGNALRYHYYHRSRGRVVRGNIHLGGADLRPAGYKRSRDRVRCDLREQMVNIENANRQIRGLLHELEQLERDA